MIETTNSNVENFCFEQKICIEIILFHFNIGSFKAASKSSSCIFLRNRFNNKSISAIYIFNATSCKLWRQCTASRRVCLIVLSICLTFNGSSSSVRTCYLFEFAMFRYRENTQFFTHFTDEIYLNVSFLYLSHFTV